jgi:hypothetical protein
MCILPDVDPGVQVVDLGVPHSVANSTNRRDPEYPIGCGSPRYPIRGRLQAQS